MLSRKARLRKNSNFEAVYKKGRCYPDKDILLFILANELPCPRCGISVSKKVSKKAVDRNKLKRRLSFVFLEESKHIIKNVDVIIVAKKNLLNYSFVELKVVVHKLLNKAKLFTEQVSC